MADGEPFDLAVAVAQEHRVAETLLVGGADVLLEVEPGIDRVGDAPGRLEQRRLLLRARGREGRRRLTAARLGQRIGVVADRLSQDRRERARPETVLRVEPDVLGTLGEGEQPVEAGAPPLEAAHDRLEQPLRHAAVPMGNVDRDRPEEADAAPAGGER